MELKGFREILLKKAEGNSTLQTLIAYAKDDVIIDKVLESLEKMARPNASMGRGANAAVVAFANQLKNKDVSMMHDALGHHVSHHRAALQAAKANPEQAGKYRKVADQHLNKIIPLMHLAGRAAPHSGGALALDYVPTEPWETNYTRLKRNETNGKLQEGTKGLGRRPKMTKRNPLDESHADYESHEGNPYGVPDYRYLESAPHPGHPDTKNSPHEGGYPFEETLLGNPAKVDAKEAYLHNHDVASSDQFNPHPFDSHPIHSLADVKQGSFVNENDPRLQRFAEAMQNWHESEPHKQYNEKVKAEYAKDPEAYKARGKKKNEHHFKDLDLQEPEHHVQEHLKQHGKPEKATSKKSAPKAEKAAAKEAPALSEEDIAKLPPALQAIYAKKAGK